MIFQVGDIVKFGGVEGLVSEHIGKTILVVFKHGEHISFTEDGRYDTTYKKPVLELVARLGKGWYEIRPT